MLILGLVLLVVAVAAVLVAIRQQRTRRLLAAADTRTAGQLREEAGIVTELGGDGGFHRQCEVVGAAQPGPDGPLTSTVSKTPCVWHRHIVRRRYRRSVSDGKGGRRQETRTEPVSEFTSGAPFTLVDQTGTVVVAPEGAKVDHPERVHREFKQGNTGTNLTALGITVQLGNQDNTIGYETEEWAIRPGTQLYVLGEATDRGGELCLGKPDGQRFIISTRSKAELTTRARRIQLLGAVTAAITLVAGGALIVMGSIT